jgi:hypothetical protein
MNSYESLGARVRQVRRRWRSQVLAKGISLFIVSTIALLVLGVWGADLFGFKPAAVWIMRFLIGGTVVFVAWYFLYMPLGRRVSAVQVAQFIEETYPQLEDRLVAAIEYGQQQASFSGMIDLLIKDALDKTSRVNFSVFLDRKRLASFAMLGVAAFLALLALWTWGPSFFPYGFGNLYAPWTEASLASSMAIRITPGDVEVARGSDQLIQAQLLGFDSPDVRLYLQPEASNQWNPSAMEPDPHGSGFRYLLIDVQSPLRYYVESKGVHSRICSIGVLDQARVASIDLTYNFPAYTQMAPQVVQGEGDISALKGTRVDLKIHLSGPAPSARLLFDNRSTLDLARTGTGDFSGSFALERSGSYVVQIADNGGKTHPGSPEYEMEALEDAPPKVTITRPMRDVRATSVEEVFSEIEADDDIGMGKLELHYSVNGDPEKTVHLYSGKPPALSVTGSHTFFLEEFGLQPGDVISYYGKAWDNNNVTGPGVSSSDMYFIQVRPFEQKYVQSQQGSTPGGGQGGEGQEALSNQQKQIISATFKLIREKERMDPKEYLDGLKALALVQSRLQAQTQVLVDRLKRRGADQVDENFRKLTEYLNNAIGEMGRAAVDLGAQKPGTAMPQEQKSLQQLMRAESLFREIQVSFAAQSAGIGRPQGNAEDLADLFELELDKLKNQYETVQRGEQESRDQKVDEALQRLRELAQRQQQLNERNRMLAQQGRPPSSAGGGGGPSQQQLVEQAEQLRRQLQRLSRERSSPGLNEASGQLQKAIDEMKKSLKDSQNGSGAQANAQGMRALEQLDEATRKLVRSQETGLNQGLEQALGESRKLVEEQNRIQEGLERLSKETPQTGSPEEIKQRREDLISRKTVLADRLKGLESQIQNLQRQARKTEKEAGGKLADAGNTIRDNKLPERIVSGNALIQYGFYENQKQNENFIRGGLEQVNRQLEAARNSIGQSKEGKIEEAAERARQLSEGLESMQRRAREIRGRQQGPQGQGQEQNPPGRQGQSAQAGRARPGQNPQGGIPSPGSDVRGFSQDASGPPTAAGTYRDEEERQLRREFEQRLADAQDLRRLLERNSSEMENLDKVMESLHRAGAYPIYNNPEQIARLKSAIDYMRQVELGLARELQRLNPGDKYYFAEDNEAPSSYQKLVEEYYKSIAKSK